MVVHGEGEIVVNVGASKSDLKAQSVSVKEFPRNCLRKRDNKIRSLEL